LAKSIIERDYPSDTDRTRSASPPGSVYNTGKKATPNMRINTLLNEDGPSSSPAPKGPGRGNWTRKGNASARAFKARLDQADALNGASPSSNAPTFSGPHGFYLPLNGSDPSHKRTRPLTQHQLAVEQYRRRRVEVILDRGLRVEYKLAAQRRRTQSPFLRAWIRCKGMSDGYDTEDEFLAASMHADADLANKTSTPIPAGLVPIDYGGEINDHGEEAYYRTKMLTRALRRMERWEENKGVVRTKPKGKRTSRGVENGGENGIRMGIEEREEEFGDEDEEMVDVEDGMLLERRDEDEEESEEEEMDGVGLSAVGDMMD
jgi:Ino eighty subunit 1